MASVIKRPPCSPDDALPWGVHKGIPIKDVPVAYLAWLRAQSWISDYPSIFAYLEGRKVELDKHVADQHPAASAAATFSTYQDYLKLRGR
jgi:hypothetical protein